MKKSTAKKIVALLFPCFMLFNTTACNLNHNYTSVSNPPSEIKEDTKPSSNISKDEASASPKVNTSMNKIEAGLGDLKLYYNNKWTYDSEQSQDASLAFTRGNALIGVVCSKENTYQLAQDITKHALDAAKEKFKDLKMIQKVKEITINGDHWYECEYKTGQGHDAQYSLQRTYAKNYYAYTVTYTGLKDDYEAYKSNALTVINSCLMEVPENPGELVAKKELAGELDAGKQGYLELKRDGTYYWYRNSSKEMDNVHYGTYACDNKIKAMNIAEGKKGYYLVLFPCKYFVNGEETDMGTYKIDFAISKDPSAGIDYRGINLSNYSVYDFTRVK